MKLLVAGALGLMATVAAAQVPDVRVKFDITLALRTDRDEKTTFKPFDMLGRHSTVSLTFFLEPGFRAFVSQKVQPFPNETDRQPLDEYYVEDEGIWRVGKQYLPFGTGAILRESVLAARGDSNLILERYPMAIAICDGGSGYQRGIVARIGNRVGASVAVGDHFGIASTALTYIRRPENSPGKGRGWKLALGGDYTRRLDNWTVRLEGVALRNGETIEDEDLTIGDLAVSLVIKPGQAVTLGWTRILPSDGDVIRAMGSFRVTNMVSLEPIVRYRDGGFLDAAFQVRLRF